MFNIPTKNQIEQRLSVLPEDFKAALFSVELANLGEKIGKENNLDSSQIYRMTQSLAWVLLGFLHESELADSLQERVNTSKDSANKIAADLSQKIISRYKSVIEKIYIPNQIPKPEKQDNNTTAPAPLPTPQISEIKKEPTKNSEAVKSWGPIKLSVPKNSSTPSPAPAPFMMQSKNTISPLTTVNNFKIQINGGDFNKSKTNIPNIPKPPKIANLEIGSFGTADKEQSIKTDTFKTSINNRSAPIRYTVPEKEIMPAATTPPPATTSIPVPTIAPKIETPEAKTTFKIVQFGP